GRALTLETRLSDGEIHPRSGYVRAARNLGADGGFTRYRLTLVPWLWLLSRGRHNRVFQEKSVIAILEAVFDDYRDIATWQWSDDVSAYLADLRPRSYCVQYCESDYAFVSRLLAEEGIGWRIEADKDAPGGHCAVFFADSRLLPEDRLSASSTGGRGIRFHRADSQEEQDTVLAFGQHCRLTASLVTHLSHDYKAKRSVAASVPGLLPPGGEHAPRIERYDDAGPYAFANSAEAEHYGRLTSEASEARTQTFIGRGTVRSLAAGTRIDLVDLPQDPNAPPEEQQPPGYLITELTQIGINNLTAASQTALAARFARRQVIEEEADDTGDAILPASVPVQIPQELLKLVQKGGYANSFNALLAATPWRPQLEDGTGQRLNPRPTVSGPMTAIVVGPNGETTPNGADEIWCDALGRIKVRFHWQEGEAPDDRDTCWIRVIQRQAGNRMGWQWLPRIGQEVQVIFLSGDIDRPIVLGALYNGRGEGGIPATPGGKSGETDTSVFDLATDHRIGGQGNLTGGNAPAWHGAAHDSHRHPDALMGFKSKEFGGSGYNQLVFDDSDDQQRIQLRSTQHASELNLGHLIHQADNYRGSFRGTGAELRTDAWGALRAGQGMLMSTWPNANLGSPVGDAAPAMALVQQAQTLAQTFSQAAQTHQTVTLAVAIGSKGNNQSIIDPNTAPLKALHTLVSGMVDAKDESQAQADAQAKNTAAGPDKVPHLTDPAIVQAAKDDFAQIAGQNLQITSGETITLASGEDTNLAVAGKTRIHAGQAIGLLAGAIQAGENNRGITIIAGKDDIDLQAQSDEMKFRAKEQVKLVSVTDRIDFAAAKKIHLAVEGGASITIDGGILVQCPGTITVHASVKKFAGPVRENYALPTFPDEVCIECLKRRAQQRTAFMKMGD
ncbi:MAG: type VI secretion system tip protein VgrG, partial [Azonexus sp.]|uniref:type VI secretion system Vgr family protein n=1 Tax=Azonexus sp. TaxID=1872668 RepID=UPI002825E671